MEFVDSSAPVPGLGKRVTSAETTRGILRLEERLAHRVESDVGDGNPAYNVFWSTVQAVTATAAPTLAHATGNATQSSAVRSSFFDLFLIHASAPSSVVMGL